MTIKGNKNISVKEINKINILRLVLNAGPISRVAISKQLGISRPTVSEYVRELIEEGLIEESGKSGSTPAGGKKAVLLKINAGAGYILAAMIGVKTIRTALTDLNSRILKIDKVPTEEWKGPGNVIEKIAKNVEGLIEESKIPFEKVIGIGIGAAGLVDSRQGRVIFSPNLSGWSDIGLMSAIEEKTSLPVFVENECRLQALAEKKFGKAKEARDFVCFETGIGIGTGVFLNNKLLVGSKGIAGEVGHLITHISSRKSCHCGNIGCLETLCSTKALLEDTKKSLQDKPDPAIHDVESLTIEDLYELYDAGHEAVIKCVEKNAGYLGIGISNAIKMFDPEIVIIHGEVIRFRQRYLDIVRQTVSKNTFPMTGQDYAIEFSDLGENVGLMGASYLVFENIFNLSAAAFSGRHIVKRKVYA